MNFGLIGQSLSHSFSPDYFNEKFLQLQLHDYTYQPFEMKVLTEFALHQLIKSNKLNGFNVTIPYKQAILPFIDSCSIEAEEIGAVNTVKVTHWPDGSFYLTGYNTDWKGFLKSLRPYLSVHHHKALILGTGGASAAIAYALKSLGIEYLFVTRQNQSQSSNVLSYNQLNAFVMEQFKLIVNTTPLGTYPDVDGGPPIPYMSIGADHLLCDLVYNPAETQFMKKGRERGAAVMNGLSMLKFQADEAFEIWTK